jgi:glutaminyl-tRNA synthetase
VARDVVRFRIPLRTRRRHHPDFARIVNDSNSTPSADDTARSGGLDFIRAIVAEDLRTGKHAHVVTRFPPEPNGYLHVGHAKSIALNFGIAQEFGGRCHLRFDDTNPETEDEHYVRSIQESVRWLGFEWGEHLYFASDYFDRMYGLAEWLVEQGRAYVDSSTEEQIRERRGSVTESGTPSPFRSRSPEENLDLLRRMKDGEFPNGAHVLRAKIDMASPNMLMRDPLLYRIRHAHHYRTGDRWCIYPMYDFAHSIEDAIECVTHSLCTLEFENNRPLYDWVVQAWVDWRRALGEEPCAPRQIEFARGNLEFTVMSKRKFLELVRGGYVDGWDDPRMPTVLGLRRRGVTPGAIRAFWERMGVAKFNSRVDVGKLEYAIRDDLNQKAPRVLCVLNPLRVTITNYPEGKTEEFDAPSFPHDVPKDGSRPLPFGRTLLIERDDFMEDPPKGFHRLRPGGEVRLRYAYIIRCDEVVRDDAGEVVELRCSYDPETRGGTAQDGRTVKGTIHWVSEAHALPCEVRLYDRLFTIPDPDEAEDFKSTLNPESLVVMKDARVEPSVADDPPESRYQFERLGYFCSDRMDSSPGNLVFNRTVTLRDTWAKREQGTGNRERSERVPAAHQGTTGARSEEGGTRKEESGKRKEGAGNGRETKWDPASVEREPAMQRRFERYTTALGLEAEEADILTREEATAVLFEGALEAHHSARGVANWVIHELPREIGGRTLENLPFSGHDLGELVRLVEDGTLSSSAGREVLAEMVNTGENPARVLERRDLRQVSDENTLAPVVDSILAANVDKAEAYRGGKTGLLGFFMGQVMARTGGRANPELAKRMLVERLEERGG